MSRLTQAFTDLGWRASDLRQDEWVVALDPHVVGELEEIAHLVSDDRHLETCTLGEVAPTFVKLMKDVSVELEDGRGFAVLRGIPIALASDRALAHFLLAIGSTLGTPVPQTLDGALVAFVTDLGKDSSKPTVRGHQTSAELPFHCDRADLIGLLCVRPAMQGGRSRLVSAVAVHDIIAEESPELLQELYRPFVQDRRGEGAPGEHPWFTMPIFEPIDGRFVSRYIRKFIDSASRFLDAPRLTQKQLAALDAIDRILTYPGVALELDFRPGDLQLLNNATIWHSRTSYEDFADPTQRRLLLRLWVSPLNSRKLGNSFVTLYGDVRAGAVRGGIRPRS